MDTLIHADIFFFVTTIAVVVVTLLVVTVLIYLIKILRRIRTIAEEIKDETIFIRQDIHTARTQMKIEGFKLKHIIDFFLRFIDRKRTKKSRTIK
jgi:hypothetical protein